MIRWALRYLGEAVARLVARPLEREEVPSEVPAPVQSVKAMIETAKVQYRREQLEKMRIALEYRVNSRGGQA